MSQIITNRIPPKQWITDAVHSHFAGHGWGPIAIVVDDDSRDDVIIMVALPKQVNAQGATAVAKFLVSSETRSSRDEVERLIHKACKKAVNNLIRAMQMQPKVILH